ncbi:DUF2972 domain-containing protein [Campylobacter helveticus]|uniref:DUF2972 domain-containing protein n=3 Tax=Campylobacter helveticus TaxID=28898 RepID=A0ABY3L4B6_9BACT|nr:DUF2972 domain-containing protein [Campylobacter helveticus]TXK60866.1 DUF2972 domain-containing protein [Campylobacter helveticus]
MHHVFNMINKFDFKEVWKRRKKRATNSITKRFGKYLVKILPKLPQNYKFILFSYSVSGHFAFTKFLTLCGLKHANLAQDNYMYYNEVKEILKNSTSKNFISIGMYRNFTKRFNYALLLSCEAPILILLRDPISRLKTHINHGYLKKKSQFEFGLKDDISEALGEIIYDGAIKPQISSLENMFDMTSISFNYQTDLAPYLVGGGKSRQVIYIDMQELMPDKAFKTMQKLSSILNFNPPKEEDKAKFERKAWSDYTLFLPFKLLIDNQDFPKLKEKIPCIITAEKLPNHKESKSLFLDENDLCYKELSINLEEKHYKLIQEDKEIKERLKSYFKEFVKVLDEKVRFRKDNAIKEQDVLDYFKANKTLALKFKNILDKELTHIKQTRPDIIQSWNYYKEFERICGEAN